MPQNKTALDQSGFRTADPTSSQAKKAANDNEAMTQGPTYKGVFADEFGFYPDDGRSIRREE